MSFITVAAGMGASGIGATLLAGGMMGAATGAVGNLVRGKGLFDNFGQNVLMGGATAGIASGIGSALGGETQAAIDAAKGVPETSGNAAADMALKQANTIRTAAIDDTVGKAALGFDANPDPEALGFYPDAYRQQLASGAAPIDYGAITQGGPPTPLADQFGAENIRKMLARGEAPGGIAQMAREDAFNNAVVPPAGMQAPGMQTKIGNYLVQNPSKVAGVASGLFSLQPNKFTPPPVKPTPYYKTSYNPPQYDPVTGTYSNPYYGPGTYSTTYAAQGGAVGYAEGGPAYYPLTGDRVNTGTPGSRGDKPKNSRDIYGDDSGAGINNDKAGEGPYSDSAGVGVYTNTPSGVEGLFAKTSATTLAKYKNAKNAAMQAAAIKELRKRAAAVDDYSAETTSAAQGGLMGLNTYAAGGKLLRGPGDGMSDSIPAVINGAKPQRAALADGEFVIPADVVSHLGNGSTEAGSKRLYSMMDKVRRARTGNPKQGKQINPEKFMPA